jgi:acyl-CoA thioesterase YciA
MSDPYLALQVLMMPKDTNGFAAAPGSTQNLLHLTVFGGVILSYIDQAGAIGAWREVRQAGGAMPFLVTVSVNRVEFKKPVLVGDVVRFVTRLVRLGRTSITMGVSVEAERDADVRHVAEAEVVYVGVDPDSRQPVPLLG